MDLQVKDISKRYANKIVLSHLSHTFKEGLIHAVIGDNGTGKSTLAAILSGALEQDSGQILINGNAVCFRGVFDAIERGIVCVKQHPPLADWLSAKDNIDIRGKMRLNAQHTTLNNRNRGRKEREQEIKTIKNVWCPSLPLNAITGELPPAMRFYTALLRALVCRPSFLILDEPTALLSTEECKSLYQHLKEAANKGMTAIVITHHKDETNECGTVFQMSSISSAALPDGKEHCSSPAPCHSQENQKLFEKEAKHEYACRITDDIAVYAGQVTLVRGDENALHLLEENVLKNAYFWRKMGAAIIPTDRVRCASDPLFTVQEMLCITHKGPVDGEYADNLIKRAGVAASARDMVKSLSGGMLQRLIMARELDTAVKCNHKNAFARHTAVHIKKRDAIKEMPCAVLAFNPLQGLDSESAQNTINYLRQAARNKKAVLVASSALFPEEAADKVIKLL